MLQAPPSRYKIVERERRLVTIDTLTGDAVGSASVVATGARVDTSTMRSTSSNMGGPVRGESAMGAARPGIQAAPSTGIGVATGSSPGTLAALAGHFPKAQLGADGRVILKTAAYYDVNAPRLMRLTDSKTSALGAYMITIGILFLFVVILVIQTDMIFGIIIVVFLTIKVGDPINKNILRNLINDAEPAS